MPQYHKITADLTIIIINKRRASNESLILRSLCWNISTYYEGSFTLILVLQVPETKLSNQATNSK